MSLFARLFRLIWGADVDRPLRPVLAVNFASSMGGSTVWSFVGLWAIRHLHASQSAVGVAFLISATVGVLAGYAGGHLSDHLGRRPLRSRSSSLRARAQEIRGSRRSRSTRPTRPPRAPSSCAGATSARGAGRAGASSRTSRAR